MIVIVYEIGMFVLFFLLMIMKYLFVLLMMLIYSVTNFIIIY